MSQRRERRGTIRETLANLSGPGSVPGKVRLFLRNNLTKMRTGERCCGNLGQPGC